jgi:hypothetical protein
MESVPARTTNVSSWGRVAVPSARRARLVTPEVRTNVGHPSDIAELGDVSRRLAVCVRARLPRLF